MHTVSFATAPKGLDPEAIRYGQKLLGRGYGFQNASRISGVSEATLREMCGRPARRVSEPVADLPRREPVRLEIAPTQSPTQEIIQRVADKYGYKPADFANKSRCRAVSYARHEAMAEVRAARPHLSTPAIGRIFGGRDHSTVITGIQDHHARVAWGEVLRVFAAFNEQPDLFSVAA